MYVVLATRSEVLWTTGIGGVDTLQYANAPLQAIAVAGHHSVYYYVEDFFTLQPLLVKIAVIKYLCPTIHIKLP